MKLRAEAVPFSSVVGNSVRLIGEQGHVVAIVMIVVPSHAFDYKEVSELVRDYIVAAFNGEK